MCLRDVSEGEDVMNSDLNKSTVDTIYDFIKDAPERQIDNANTLDNKMVQVFAAAGVVIGLLGFASGNLGSAWYITACLLGALISYAATAFIALSQLRPKLFMRSMHGDTLWPITWQLTDLEVKHAIIADVTKSYGHNRSLLASKARATLCCLCNCSRGYLGWPSAYSLSGLLVPRCLSFSWFILRKRTRGQLYSQFGGEPNAVIFRYFC
jgi:hypothetical protein